MDQPIYPKRVAGMNQRLKLKSFRLTRVPICQQGVATTRRKSEVAIMLDGKAATARAIVGLSTI